MFPRKPNHMYMYTPRRVHVILFCIYILRPKVKKKRNVTLITRGFLSDRNDCVTLRDDNRYRKLQLMALGDLDTRRMAHVNCCGVKKMRKYNNNK